MEIDLEMLGVYCDEASDLLTRWEQICLELGKTVSPEHYQELFRIAHNLKGGSRAMGLMSYGDFVHKIEDLITLLRDEKLQLSPSLLAQLLEAQQILLQWTQNLRQDPKHEPSVASFLESFGQESLLAEAPTSPPPASPTHELNESPQAEQPMSAETEPTPPAPSRAAGTKTQEKHKKPISNETIRIATNKLDELIQVISELSIHQSIVWHSRSVQNENRMAHNSLQLSLKLVKELYDKALSLRMQPLQSVFQRLERNITDLAHTLNKQVQVTMSGSDVELDKTVIEKIVDPLTHLVRNAIDHGVETPEIRLEKGKPEFGQISVTARKDTFGVEIVIADDGKGLNPEKLRQKAIQKGLIRESDNLSQSEIFKLILMPGFSTAEKISDISGRGVGMDIVKRTLEDLQGQLSIESQDGQGTQFIITLPTSVSLIEAILIRMTDQTFVVPVGSIEEVIRLSSPLAEQQKMMIHHDQVLPLNDLESLLNRKPQAKVNYATKSTVLVCRHHGKKMGLLVDSIVGQQQVVIRPLNENIEGAFGMIGGTILGNGEPGLIIDLPSLTRNLVPDPNQSEVAA